MYMCVSPYYYYYYYNYYYYWYYYYAPLNLSRTIPDYKLE